MKKIVFTDWWDGFDIHNNFITQALEGAIEYQVLDGTDALLNRNEVDFVFCSVFGKEALSYKCPRIFFTGENEVPDFNIYDYGIGFDNISFGDRYIRFPLYAAFYPKDCEKMMDKNESLNFVQALRRDFCSMVVSNGYLVDPYREDLFNKLCEYKFVASGGRYKNNIDQPEGIEDKLDFLGNYKFNISCENVSHLGYCTEKIVQAFAAKTVPIYWGDPNVVMYFNPRAFVNCNDYDSIEDVVNAVKILDEDDKKYQEMLSEPAIVNDDYRIDKLRNDFKIWLINVVDQEKDVAYRRTLKGRSEAYENRIIECERLLKNNEQVQKNSLLCIAMNKIKQMIHALLALLIKR